MAPGDVQTIWSMITCTAVGTGATMASMAVHCCRQNAFVRALSLFLFIGAFVSNSTSLAADYKSEFKMSIVPNRENSWGQAAERFADAVRYRTQGRIQIKNYFNGQLFAGKQTTEFALLQQGVADFAINSTINWSLQVKELNLFSLPFMFPSYNGLDAVEAGDPGKQIFNAIEQKGVVPIAWGENGFRELTNSKRSIRRPDDLRDLTIRVPPIPILEETFKALGANPVSMNFDQALIAFQQGKVDGQENPIALIIPYRLWAVHNHITLWQYAIDPLILAVSGKTWAMLSVEDRNIVRQVGAMMMELQKDEARDAPVKPEKLLQLLQEMYGMDVVRPSSIELDAFRRQTRSVYDKWAKEIGLDLIGSAEKIVDRGR
jgi:tripartite ATP-independent transporter DctP family solute receptor